MIPLAALSSLNYNIFVFPNSFAPSGIDGITTMAQYLFNINIGYLSLAVNIPLLAAGFFILNREFVAKTAVYTLSFSLFSLLFKLLDLSAICYHTDSGTSIVLAPIAAGAVRGVLYAVTLKFHGSSGGVDIIAKIVNKYKPNYSLMNIIFYINLIIAIAAYFVYGFKIEPVICSIIYSFVTSNVANRVEASRKGER